MIKRLLAVVVFVVGASAGVAAPAAGGPAPTAGGGGPSGGGGVSGGAGINSSSIYGGVSISGGYLASGVATHPQSVGSSTGTWVAQIDERMCGTVNGVYTEVRRGAPPPQDFIPESTVTTWALYAGGGGMVGTYEQNGCEGEPIPTPPPPLSAVFEAAPLPEPIVATSPEGDGLVALENWFWYEQATTVGISPTIGSWTVSGVAVAVHFEWDTGPGRVGSSVPGSRHNPAAEYTYRRAGEYAIQASVTWTATFTFSGWGVSFGAGSDSVTVTGPPLDYPVLQAEAIVVDD